MTESFCVNCTEVQKCPVKGWLFTQNGSYKNVYKCPKYEKYEKQSEIINKLKYTMPKQFWSKNFSNFKTVTPELKEMRDTALIYARKKAWTKGSCLGLFGNYGVGKTHIAASVAREAAKTGSIAFITASAISGTFIEIREKFEVLKKAELLILDDISFEVENSFIIQELFSLINFLYESEKGFVFTTNLTVSNFENLIGGRIFDRLYERSFFLELKDTESYREEKRNDYIDWIKEG